MRSVFSLLVVSGLASSFLTPSPTRSTHTAPLSSRRSAQEDGRTERAVDVNDDRDYDDDALLSRRAVLRVVSSAAAGGLFASFAPLASRAIPLPSFGSGGSGSSGGGAEKLPPQAPPPVTAPSSERAVAVAKALEAKGAKMYGAFWCSHCFEQKQALGKEAMTHITYVECAGDGVDSQRNRADRICGYVRTHKNLSVYICQQMLVSNIRRLASHFILFPNPPERYPGVSW